jgi:hypothetical protein
VSGCSRALETGRTYASSTWVVALSAGCASYPVGWGRPAWWVGSDIQTSMLEAARVLVDDQSLDNVELVEDDLFSSASEPASFDLVHACFQLAPLGRFAEQMATYRKMVKPGGLLVLLQLWQAPSRTTRRRRRTGRRDRRFATRPCLPPAAAAVCRFPGAEAARPHWARRACPAARRGRNGDRRVRLLGNDLHPHPGLASLLIKALATVEIDLTRSTGQPRSPSSGAAPWIVCGGSDDGGVLLLTA